MNFESKVINFINETFLGKDLSETFTTDGMDKKTAKQTKWNLLVKRSGKWGIANKKPMSMKEVDELETRYKKSGIKIDDMRTEKAK